MIRILIAASLVLGAGSAFAQGRPSYDDGAASAARTLGATASPGIPYGSVVAAPGRDPEATGSLAPRANHQRAIGLRVPGSF